MKPYEKHEEVICPRCGKLGRKHLEKTSCGKKNCKKCGGVRKIHGPYWYLRHYQGSKQVGHHYIGKTFPEEPTDKAIEHLVASGQAETKEEAVKLYQSCLKEKEK